ncbi:hypothetical protein BP5796_11452 [Coleophoma crateriformis]|uniref:Annexin ANXC4 n=1 Tax=Coleophoma crateriformis TaxID=565419 RepID=A0A3D8QIR6_9HELO|nr:hypothetical protein BP5796_11452 [Coleophoma crateriformis]
MSLDPRDSHRRGRSKSPGRERERSRSRVDEREHSRSRVIERAPSPPASRYDERDYDDYDDDPRDHRSSRDPRDPRYVTSSSSKYRGTSPMPGGYVDDEDDVKPRRREKEYLAGDKYARDDRRRGASPARGYGDSDAYKYEVESKTREREREREREHEREIEKERERDRERKRERERERELEREQEREREREIEREKEFRAEYEKRFEAERLAREKSASFHLSGGMNLGRDRHSPPHRGYSPPTYSQPDPLAYGAVPPEIKAAGGNMTYADPKQWQYAQPSEKVTYSSRDGREKSYYSSSEKERSRHNSYAGPPPAQILTVEPGSRHHRDPSPGGLAPRMHSLSVSTGHHGGAGISIATAPGSPLLEAYHGTYQSISPMPSPLMIASTPHSGLDIVESISPLSSDDERGGYGKKKRSARFHDPQEEAVVLAKALKGEKRAPDTGPLVEILPSLTHEQVMDLRVEYKKIVKTGSEKKGVNIAKHIKMRLKEEDPLLMKACYVCALGKWESEAYWANFWYQGEKSRRELLIESLMGRTNYEIHEIKDGFSDKKYSDSLTKCMKTELKEDKFKKAVLLVLEEKKMEDHPSYGLDKQLIQEDVKDLHKAVRSEKGGESAMINIIVVRSDAHLREVLRLYESTYRSNFAREMLKKSGNLGELLAHILNGVINKPVRDALLLNHALTLSKSDSIRTELLISRLVRYHWDRLHFEAVKREYRNRYGTDLQRAVADGTRGEWGRFCEMLCVRRMGDEVKYLAGR